MDLFKTANTVAYANILADPDAVVIAIPCTIGQGALKAGTLMYRTALGTWSPASTSEIGTTYQLAVLAQDVDTLEAGVAQAAEDAAAYQAGQFIRGGVFLKSGDTITASHEVSLRLQGILIAPMADGVEFDNGTVKITYKANNSTEEADVVQYAAKGSTYTVVGNTVTGFTAPATKSFSKWNTAAAGSGTDYAAAATYTANADLTLYAVWAS